MLLVEKGKTSKKYGGSVQWLKNSAVVDVGYNISEPYIPLVANEKEEQFKLYINDSALLFIIIFVITADNILITIAVILRIIWIPQIIRRTGLHIF